MRVALMFFGLCTSLLVAALSGQAAGQTPSEAATVTVAVRIGDHHAEPRLSLRLNEPGRIRINGVGDFGFTATSIEVEFILLTVSKLDEPTRDVLASMRVPTTGDVVRSDSQPAISVRVMKVRP